MLLKLGNEGPDVAALVDDLRRLGFELPAGNRYDARVKKSVEAFQVSNLDPSGMPLEVDGKVGPLTRAAIEARVAGTPPAASSSVAVPAPAAGGSDAGQKALGVAIAEMQAGHGEEGGDNRGQYVRTYLNGVPEGSSWCAGFVSWCFRTGLGRDAVFGYLTGAQAVHNRMKKLGHAYDASLSNPPQPGDIIVWRRVDPAKAASTAWQGHVGLVYAFRDGVLWTIEGNRGPYPSKVQSFRYTWSTLVVSATNDAFKGLFGLSRHP